MDMAVFAQRTEKVKVRIGALLPPLSPAASPALRRGGVRKVYFLHTAALPHSSLKRGRGSFSHSPCTYRCQNHRADSLQRRWFLARLRSRRQGLALRDRPGHLERDCRRGRPVLDVQNWAVERDPGRMEGQMRIR